MRFFPVIAGGLSAAPATALPVATMPTRVIPVLGGVPGPTGEEEPPPPPQAASKTALNPPAMTGKNLIAMHPKGELMNYNDSPQSL